MRKKNVGAARRPTTLHQRASSTKKYPKCPIETKMIAAVFSQSVSSTGGDTLFERVASSTLRGSPLSFLSRVTVLRRRRRYRRAGSRKLGPIALGNRAREPDRVCELTGQVLLVFRASATGNEPYFVVLPPAVEVFTRVTEPRRGGTARSSEIAPHAFETGGGV